MVVQEFEAQWRSLLDKAKQQLSEDDMLLLAATIRDELDEEGL
jgi:hypothetical protein